MTGALGALDRLRLRISAWYVATCAGIILLLGTGLFFAIAQQAGQELDRTLDDAVRARAALGDAPRVALRIPGVTLYVTDSLGAAPGRGTMSGDVARVARRAAVRGTADDELPSEQEHVLRLHARRFRTLTGAARVAVATSDLEDLEDRYQQLIAQFAIAAVAALGLLGFGGVFLARKFAVPVEATVERMREFMSDAAHELRTPVAVLRTESEVALARARDGVQDHAAFQRIAGDAARLAAVVDDLFTLARAESGELAIEHLSLFLDDLVSDAVSSFATVATQRGVVLALGDFDEAPVMGSALLLRRLVGILLDNAIKYSGRGTRTVVSISATATAVAVTVADTGAGISAAALPRICDRFFRGDDARAAAPGAGLGLAIAVRIAELHHGTLVIESDVGRGTIARFSMPRRLGIRSDLSAEPATM